MNRWSQDKSVGCRSEGARDALPHTAPAGHAATHATTLFESACHRTAWHTSVEGGVGTRTCRQSSARTAKCKHHQLHVPLYRQVHAQRMAFMGHTNRFPHVTTSLSLDVLRQCRSYDDGDDAPALLLVVLLLLDLVSEPQVRGGPISRGLLRLDPVYCWIRSRSRRSEGGPISRGLIPCPSERD